MQRRAFLKQTALAAAGGAVLGKAVAQDASGVAQDALPPAPDAAPAVPGACFDAAAASLPVQAGEALARIDGQGRQLLAVRSYLRAADLAGQWSWSQERIEAYEGSAAQRAAVMTLAKQYSAFTIRWIFMRPSATSIP